jgi:hypothetical protein
MVSVGFEIAIPARETPQSHTLDRASAGFGHLDIYLSDFGELVYESNATGGHTRLIRF